MDLTDLFYLNPLTLIMQRHYFCRYTKHSVWYIPQYRHRWFRRQNTVLVIFEISMLQYPTNPDCSRLNSVYFNPAMSSQTFAFVGFSSMSE